MFYMIGAIGSAIILVPVAVVVAFAICFIFMFNLIARELMLAAWDLAMDAVSDIEVFVKDLVSETASVTTVKEGRN